MFRATSHTRRAQDEDGISLVEVLIAFFLLGVAMLAIGSVAFSGLFSLRFSTDAQAAGALASRAVEASRNVDWSTLAMDSSVHGALCAGGGVTVDIDDGGQLEESVVCLDGGSVGSDVEFWTDTSDGFRVRTFVTAIDGYENARRVTSVVSWDDRGRDRELRTGTVIAEVGRG